MIKQNRSASLLITLQTTPGHLFKLFELKIGTIEPALGIELFTLETSAVEDVITLQETFWTANSSLESNEVAELLDGLQSKFGNDIIHRYLPDEHHLPERSVKQATSLQEKPSIPWRTDKLRPIQLLKEPQYIEVTAPIPDYPPMNFRYKGKLHKVQKSDACERIEAEWWLEGGLHRDYYIFSLGNDALCFNINNGSLLWQIGFQFTKPAPYFGNFSCFENNIIVVGRT